jgi:DNA-binding PadR family transcriptional regulator
MGLDPSLVVALLNPLEKDGYVSRDRDPADRRRHTVSLTPAGATLLAAAADAQRAVEDDLFAALDAQQREHLRILLLALRQPARDCGSARSDAAARSPTMKQVKFGLLLTWRGNTLASATVSPSMP